MAGYSRQSVADIIANAVIKAAPVNAEFNAVRDAFSASTGHRHDGSSTEGAYVPLIADVDAKNKVVVDSTNNRISIYSEVGGAAVEQIRIQDGAIVPVTDNDVDLGASGAEFKDLYVDGIGYIDSVVITGGTIDGVTIGGTTPAAADFTTVDTTGNVSVGGTLNVTGQVTLGNVDINGGAIDGTPIGASTAAAGTFTTVTTSGQATLASADINGGTIDGTVIGGTTAQAITGTTITADTGFSGTLTGNVTGNVTGNLTGDVTGDVTGGLTGNVTAASGTSTFNDVTVNGTLDVTGTTIANVTDPVNAQDAATKNYVDTAVADVVDAAPAALDTLNELAAALGDDADFSTTVTNSIATKLPLSGGTMSGAIAMGTSKITGMGDPTANQDAATKAYVDTQRDTRLATSGGTMTGDITLGANKATSTATPTADDDLTRKAYVDSILGSGTAAATSAANAATSETNAATSETNAATSETNAASSASAAAASYDSFDDRYLGAKASAPTLDNDGDALITGALYFNTTVDELYVWTGSAWSQASFTASGFLSAGNNLSDLANATTARTNLGLGAADDATFSSATVDYVDLTQGSNPAHSEGRVFYDNTNKALAVYNSESDITLQVGQEEYIRVYNNTGSTIDNGTPVYLTGESGTVPTIAPSSATSEAMAYAVGLATHSIEAGSYGFVTVRGLVGDIDTSGLTVGNRIHVSPTTGELQDTAPTYPYFATDMGICLISNASTGCIYVDVQTHHVETIRITGDARVDNDFTVGGDLTVLGTQTIASSNNVSIGSAWNYFNSGDTIGEANTTFTGSGLDDGVLTGHFEGTASTAFYVEIDGVGTGTGGVDTFKWSYNSDLSSPEATTVDITGSAQELSDGIEITFNATTGHTSGDKWSGTAAPVNVDTGIASNRNTGGTGVGYTHMGFFFDVSDEKWKIFSEYDPEPTGTINTGDASFTAGTLVADTFEGDLVAGTVTVSGTVDGRDIAADGTKLDGIEASADVTDTANVTAAGALMDSELTNITAVKAINQGLSTTDTALFASIHENYTALSGTTPTIDADTAGSFAISTTGNTTFTFSSVTSGRTVGFVLQIIGGGTHTITWPSSVVWAGGTAPDAPANAETDILVFYTANGGNTWYGALAIDAAE